MEQDFEALSKLFPEERELQDFLYNGISQGYGVCAENLPNKLEYMKCKGWDIAKLVAISFYYNNSGTLSAIFDWAAKERFDIDVYKAADHLKEISSDNDKKFTKPENPIFLQLALFCEEKKLEMILKQRGGLKHQKKESPALPIQQAMPSRCF